MAMAEMTGFGGNWLARKFDRMLEALVPPAPEKVDDADATRCRRDFVLEMMDACPEAFESERDVCQMMHLFPGRF